MYVVINRVAVARLRGTVLFGTGPTIFGVRETWEGMLLAWEALKLSCEGWSGPEFDEFERARMRFDIFMKKNFFEKIV